MDWLAQNWTLVVIGIAALWLFRRAGLGGCGMHGGASGSHGPGHAGGHSGHSGETHSEPAGSASDPVSGAPVRVGEAPSAVYLGQAYYFASRENRDRFEADPAQYARAAPGPAGAVQGTAGGAGEQPRRHGCC